MSKARQWSALTLVLVVAVIAAGWFLLISPQRSKAADLRAQAQSQEDTNAGLATRLQMLKAQQADVVKEQTQIQQIDARIPSDPQLPALVRSLTAIAKDNHVDLKNISPDTPAKIDAPKPTAQPSGSTAASGAAPTPSDQLYGIHLSLTVNGDYFAIRQFEKALEDLSRTGVVSSISIAPGQPVEAPSASPTPATGGNDAASQWKQLDATISVTVFMATHADSASPAASASGTPSATGASGSAGSTTAPAN